MLGAWFDAGEATSSHDRGRTRIRPERDTDGARSCQCGSIDRGSELTEPATDDALGRKRNYPRVCTADFRASQVHPGTRLRRRVRSGSRFSASAARLLLDRIRVPQRIGEDCSGVMEPGSVALDPIAVSPDAQMREVVDDLLAAQRSPGMPRGLRG